MIDRIDEFIEKHHLIKPASTIVLGLSGGADSVFLLHLLHQKKISIVAAHLDHEWRTDSYKDVIFCKNMCDSLQIPFVHGKASDIAHDIKKNGSQEELGRKMRRIFLEAVAHQYNAQAIALAHHLNDQEETFFIRLIRSTTLTGLIGMRPKHGIYIRPLLEVTKQEIVTYLNEHNITYLQDPTNDSPIYLRNRIRPVIQALHNCDERFDQNFLRTLYSLQTAESFLEQVTQETFNHLASMTNGAYQLHIPSLLKQNPYMLKRILLYWLILEGVPFVPSETFLNEIIRFLQQTSPEHRIHETWLLARTNDCVSITKQAAQSIKK